MMPQTQLKKDCEPFANDTAACEIANDRTKAIADKFLAEKDAANKPQSAIVESESVGKNKKDKK